MVQRINYALTIQDGGIKSKSIREVGKRSIIEGQGGQTHTDRPPEYPGWFTRPRA